MTALTNRAGPTRIWKTIKGKNVKTNDGKDIGKIKEISENHLQVEQGKVHKHSFWVPKYVADAFDGKVLWLLLSEEEVRERYQYGAEPPAEEHYTSEFERFKKTAYGQKVSYASDFNENIRVVENYSNIRDLQSTASTQIPETVGGKEEDQKEQNIKDIETTKTESIQSTEYHSKKQPINTDSPVTKSTAQSVQPIAMASKSTESEVAAVEVNQKKKDNNNFSSSPIRLPTSYTKQETPRVEDMHGNGNGDGDRDKRNLPADRKESASPVRITSNVPTPKQPTTSTSTSASTTMDKPGNTSPVVSPLSSINVYQKDKETNPSPPSIVKLDSTKIEQKPHDDIATKSDIQSASMMAASSTPTAIISDKDKDTNTNTDIQPVLAEVTLPIVEVKPEEQQIVPVSVNNEKQSLDLPTTTLKSTSIEEVKPNPTSLMPANLEQSNQMSLYDKGHTTTDEDENVNSFDYFNPFLAGMSMWQAWLNMCSEFAAIGANLSLNWLDSFWRFLIPCSKDKE